MTITTRHSELDTLFYEYFNIRYGTVPNPAEGELQLGPGEALAFEFDYPDRPGLSLLRSTKQCYPQVPIVMITTQHSEELAVWAYRNRVIDFLTMPVTRTDLVRCSQLLQAVQNADSRQKKRTIFDHHSRIPGKIRWANECVEYDWKLLCTSCKQTSDAQFASPRLQSYVT